MIVLVTSPWHGVPVKPLVAGTFGFDLPACYSIHYHHLFRRTDCPVATYIFTDIERLAPWELLAATSLFRFLRGKGLRCLNDPAKVRTRVELLRLLSAKGISDVGVWRADELPKPDRFPVFIRSEDDHVARVSDLIHDQSELEQGLALIREHGRSLRGLIVLAWCPSPYRDGLWNKWGTFKIGDSISVDHIAVDKSWVVKFGDYALHDDAIIDDEHDAVMTNRFEPALRPAFEAGCIDYGRADHGFADGRLIVYEINTNPNIGEYLAAKNPKSLEKQRRARQRLAEAFFAIDTKEEGRIAIDAENEVLRRGRENPADVPFWRP